jgi:hypothetical protein
MRRDFAAAAPGSIALLTTSGGSSDPEQVAASLDAAFEGWPAVQEWLTDVWIAGPFRWREETRFVTHPEAPHTSIEAMDRSRMWTWSSRAGRTQEWERKPFEDPPFPRSAHHLFDPWELVPLFEFGDAHLGHLLGRPALWVSAHVRAQPEADPGIYAWASDVDVLGEWLRADAYEFVVDLGGEILLRSASSIEGEECEVDQILDVRFDEPIPDGLFSPAG